MNKESKRRGDWESPLERKGLKGFPPINHDRTRATKMMHRRSFISLDIFHRYGETLMISLFFFSSSVNTFSSANSTLLSCFARNSGWIRPTRWFLSLESEGMLWEKKANGWTRLKRVHPIVNSVRQSSLTSRFHDSRFSMTKHVENEVWKLKLATSWRPRGDKTSGTGI